MRYFFLVRAVLLAGSVCFPLRSQEVSDFAYFRSMSHGFSVKYPRSWYPHIASDIFSINNFPPSRAVRGEVLPSGGAGIFVLTSEQELRDSRNPRDVSDFVELDNARQSLIDGRTLEVSGEGRRLAVIEIRTLCCEPTQESVSWYFEIEKHMFVGILYYFRGDPNADKLHDTLKEVVLSLRILGD